MSAVDPSRLRLEAAADLGQQPRPPGGGEDVVSAAEQFEGIMIHELMKAMRATVPGEEQGFAMETAYSMFDQAISDSAAGGLGLAPMIARDMGASPEQLATMRGGASVGGARIAATTRGIASYQAMARPGQRIDPTGGPARTRDTHGVDAPGLDHVHRDYVGYARHMPRAGALAGTPRAGLDPVDGIVSSEYGWREHPIHKTRKFHEGLDIAAPEGTEIRAVDAGKVVYAGKRGGYGNVVELEHADGTITRYAHASRLHVQRGDRIEVGEAIADVGQTGHATGPHLHFEVRRDGKAIDPKRHLQRLGER